MKKQEERHLRQACMMRSVLGMVTTIIFIAFAGCADLDQHYVAEKMLWKAQHAASNILQKAGERKLNESEFNAIIALFRKVSDSFPLDRSASEAQFNIADLYLRQGKFDQARTELKRVIENFSTQPPIASRAQSQIAKSFEVQGNIQEAMAEYDKILDLYPLTQIGLETPLYLIEYYQSKKDDEGKEKALRQAIRHYTKMINDYAKTSAGGFYYNYLARAYLKAEEWENALETWEKVVTHYPDTSSAMRALLGQAEVYAQQLKNDRKAIERFETFIKHYPKFELIKQVQLRLAGLYLANDQTASARQIFTTLLKENPSDKEIGVRCHFGLAACARKDRNPSEVVKEYQIVRDQFPDDPRSLGIPLLIYRYYVDLNEQAQGKQVLESAIKEYEHLMQVYAKDARKLIVVARALFFTLVENKNYDKALALLQKFDRQYPHDPGFLLSMASLYQNQLNQPQLAKQAYEDVVKRFPKNTELVKAANKKIIALEKMLLQKETGK